MTDPIQSGIGSLVRGPDAAFDAKLLLSLGTARPLTELAQLYTDPEDQRRVRGRELICLALRAIFEHVEGKGRINPDGSLDVLPTDDGISDLATALRDFEHDRSRIDAGATPERLLKPIAPEAVDKAKGMRAGRSLLIHWLVAIALWDKKVDLQFRTQTDLLNFASSFARTTAGRLKTERKNFEAGSASHVELGLYHDLIDEVSALSSGSADRISPFKLFLPGVMALSA